MIIINNNIMAVELHMNYDALQHQKITNYA